MGEKYREKNCTNLASYTIEGVKFLIHTGPVWEVRLMTSNSERLESDRGMCDWDDDDYLS